MTRLRTSDLVALGVMAFLAINLGARYGALVGMLALALLPITAVAFSLARLTDEQLQRLTAERDAARNQRDDAIAQRMRDQIRAGRWS